MHPAVDSAGSVTPVGMPTSIIIVALTSSGCALLAGWLLGKASTRAQLGNVVPAQQHREEIQALRKRYRRRLRAARNVLVQHKASRDQIRNALKEAENRHAIKAELLATAEREADARRLRVAELEASLAEHQRLLAGLRADREALQQQRDDAQEKFASTERVHGLLRIERDELAAQTQRLQALPRVTPSPAGSEGHEDPVDDAAVEDTRAQIGALRESLANRDSRIHELECKVREAESRARDLESNLHTWKLRIAPLAFQLKRQRERARRLLAADAPPQAPPDEPAPGEPAASPPSRASAAS